MSVTAAGHVHHFAMGSWLPLLAYVVSAIGSIVGLACTLQARRAGDDRRPRYRWLVLAAMSIGGVGIWLMHFLAMLGFDTPGMPVRYHVGRTAISAILSIGAVFLGLVVFGVRSRFSYRRLLLAGLITGLAVNLMHYTGMWAVQVRGMITYDPATVWLSVGIAVVAATATFWFTVIEHPGTRVLAGLVMGLAVSGMHYTGMAAARVHLDPTAPAPSGVEGFTFLFPVFVASIIALSVPLAAVLMPARWPDNDEVVEPAMRHALRGIDQRVTGYSGERR